MVGRPERRGRKALVLEEVGVSYLTYGTNGTIVVSCQMGWNAHGRSHVQEIGSSLIARKRKIKKRARCVVVANLQIQEYVA
jgi:hypothetical protein